MVIWLTSLWLRWLTRHGSVPWTPFRLRVNRLSEIWTLREFFLRLRMRAWWAGYCASWRTWRYESVETCSPLFFESALALQRSAGHVWKVCQRGLGIEHTPWWMGERVRTVLLSARFAALIWIVRALMAAVAFWAMFHDSSTGVMVAAGPYFVSPFGSDSNNGLGPDASHASNKPFLTFGKLIAASGAMASGETAYVAPGIYREQFTVGITSPTAETFILGDPKNAQGFKDSAGTRLLGGPVEWLSGNFGSGSQVVDLNGRDFLTFADFRLRGDGNASFFVATTAVSTNITFRRCACYPLLNNNAGNLATVTSTFGTALHWLFDQCVMHGRGRLVQVNLPSGSGADYDADVIAKNCLHVSLISTMVVVTGTGASAQFGGGVIQRNCTYIGSGSLFSATGAGLLSTSIPCKTLNSHASTSNAFVVAATSGQITENYNSVLSGSRTNTTAGVNSNVAAEFPNQSDLASFFKPVAPQSSFQPMFDAMVVGFGSDGSHPSTDFFGLPRPCGTMTFGDSGTATSGAAGTLTDTGKAWATNGWVGWMVKITSGTGSGQVKQVKTNTATVLTLQGNWVTNPDNTSVYTLYHGARATSGKATAGAATTMTDSGATWVVNGWQGWTLAITAGTGSGQTTTVTSNTATVLTVPTWGTNPDNTSVYKLYRGTDENTVNVTAGAFERANTMVSQSAVTSTGTAALRAIGPAVQDFDVPVNAVATRVKVWARFNSTYAGTKPQLKVIDGEECGVSDATATAAGSADTWEELTLTFTPARAGIVTIRLQANSTATLGLSFFDDLSLSPAVNPLGFDDHFRRGAALAGLSYTGSGYSRGRVVNG